MVRTPGTKTAPGGAGNSAAVRGYIVFPFVIVLLAALASSLLPLSPPCLSLLQPNMKASPMDDRHPGGWSLPPTMSGIAVASTTGQTGRARRPQKYLAAQQVRVPVNRPFPRPPWPLIGLYDSADVDVARWHVRLAQAAGIDAFLVSWWGQVKERDLAFESGPLAAAGAALQNCLFDERAKFHQLLADYKAMLTRALRKYKESPAPPCAWIDPWFIYRRAGVNGT